MKVAVGHQTGADQLGRWRFGARGELRALPRFVRRDEPVVAMALGSVGAWKGRLFVATPDRLLLVSKHLLRPARCTEIPYPRIQVSGAESHGGGLRVSVVARSEQQTWYLYPARSAERLVQLIGEHGQTDGTTEPARAGITQSAVSEACTSGPGTALRALLNLAALAVIVLYFIDVVARDPALAAFLALSGILAVAEWRASTAPLQIALGATAALAVALFVFEVLPFALGALVAGAGIAAEIAFRRRSGRVSMG
jgi:hypothetical protein